MPKQFTLNLTKKELAILEHCLELLGNEMLAEAEDTQKKNIGFIHLVREERTVV